jgi:hypothetical protein
MTPRKSISSDPLKKALRLLRMWVTFYNHRTLVISSSIIHRDVLTKETDEFLAEQDEPFREPIKIEEK